MATIPPGVRVAHPHELEGFSSPRRLPEIGPLLKRHGHLDVPHLALEVGEDVPKVLANSSRA